MSDKKTKAAPAAKGGAKAPAAKAAAGKPAAAPAAPAKAAPAAPAQVSTAELKSHSFRRKMIGTVTSNKMNKTVVVEVIRKAMDPMYKKYIRVRDKYKAHDEQNQYQVGDRVD